MLAACFHCKQVLHGVLECYLQFNSSRLQPCQCQRPGTDLAVLAVGRKLQNHSMSTVEL